MNIEYKYYYYKNKKVYTQINKIRNNIYIRQIYTFLYKKKKNRKAIYLSTKLFNLCIAQYHNIMVAVIIVKI